MRPTREQREIQRELDELARMPNVRLLDKLTRGVVHPYIPANVAALPWPPKKRKR